MRSTFSEVIEKGRIREGKFATATGERMGAFRLRHPFTGGLLQVIISDGSDWQLNFLPGEPWEHVSVSTKVRVPDWMEMCWVKSLFFEPEECVVQFHPPLSKYVNANPNVLHLWKMTATPFPMPPLDCV